MCLQRSTGWTYISRADNASRQDSFFCTAPGCVLTQTEHKPRQLYPPCGAQHRAGAPAGGAVFVHVSSLKKIRLDFFIGFYRFLSVFACFFIVFCSFLTHFFQYFTHPSTLSIKAVMPPQATFVGIAGMPIMPAPGKIGGFHSRPPRASLGECPKPPPDGLFQGLS